uniref:SCP domain-containing protein n=1 Tax=Glossina brevipalpis TaxID=37001 RepID=A0A1A9WS17_9MUSC
MINGREMGASGIGGKDSVFEHIALHLKMMYDEKDKVTNPIGFADQLESSYLKDSGHFSQLMGDRISRVGCAFAVGGNCTADVGGGEAFQYCYYLACHYDFASMTKWRLYKRGTTPASDCGEWNVGKHEDPRYPNLCKETIELFNYYDPKG